MDPNEKIQLDDISFDDVIAGDGIDTVPVEELEPLTEEVETTDEAEDSDDPLEDILGTDENEEEAEEEDTEEEEDDDYVDDEDGQSTIVGEVLDHLGYDLEDGKYDDTPEGLANMTTDIASEMADERIDEVLEAFPLVKKHLDYVLAGGQSQNFMEAYDPNLDYHQISIEEDDTRSQKALLGDYLELKGHDEGFIEEMLNDFEDTGKLYAKAEAARGALAKHQDSKRDQLITQQRQETSERKEELDNFWSNVSETIEDSDSFAGIAVPKKDKNKFFDYLSTPVTKEGHTQRDVDHSEADMEIKLAIDYLMYTGFDLSEIISSKAKTQNAKTLRERIGKNEDRVKSTRRSSRRNSKLDLDTLDLSL
tara:strand:+ start:41 stop:1135 length:1095 start_codon:yes stop_codon:yes gene_type:complete